MRQRLFNKISVERKAGETGRNFPIYGFCTRLFRQMKCYGERWYEGSIGSMGMLLLFIALLIILFFMGGKNESHLQSHLESSEEQLRGGFGNRGDSEKKWGG